MNGLPTIPPPPPALPPEIPRTFPPPGFGPPHAPKPTIPRRWRLILGSFLLVPMLVATGLFVPTDYYALSPGPAEDVGRLIKVGNASAPSKGSFMLTTVSVTVDRISIFESLRAAIDPAIETVPRSALVQPGLTDDQQDQLNRADMEESKFNASVVAATIAGIPVRQIPGARVILVLRGLPAHGVLRDGDVITEVEGVTVRNAGEMSAQIKRHPPGSRLRFRVQRDGLFQEFTIASTTEPSDPDKRPVVGIITGPAFDIPVEIDINSHDIVGPSAGLMFTLALADALTDEDLTSGKRIAGTGTIDLDGNVGPIGGVAQKVRAAEHAGAQVFLAPVKDFPEAKRTARRLRVFKVATIREAVDLLATLSPQTSR